METNLRDALSHLNVLEIGDQSGDYTALLLAGLGADVIKLEPPSGSPSRQHRSLRIRRTLPRTEPFLLAL